MTTGWTQKQKTEGGLSDLELEDTPTENFQSDRESHTLCRVKKLTASLLEELKKSMPRHAVLRLLRGKKKENILPTARGTGLVSQKEQPSERLQTAHRKQVEGSGTLFEECC